VSPIGQLGAKRPGGSIFIWTRRLWRWTDPDRQRSTVAIVLANLVPLVGALFLRWNVGAIVVLFWLECGVVGILNLTKIALAEGGSASPGGSVIGGILKKVVAIPFFLFHYGAFFLASGGGALFLVVAASGTMPPTNGPPGATFRQTLAMLDLPIAGLILATAALVFRHLVAFNDFLAHREYEGVDPFDQTVAAYPSVFVLLAATLASGTFIAVLGSPVWAVASFVVGKTVLDLRLTAAERQRHLSRV
jgi:hypothetical protein